MTELSQEQAETARKNYSAFLQALASTGQKNLAEALGLSETAISRWKQGDMELATKALAVLGLRIVPLSDPYVPKDYLSALKVIVRHSLSEEQPEPDDGKTGG